MKEYWYWPLLLLCLITQNVRAGSSNEMALQTLTGQLQMLSLLPDQAALRLSLQQLQQTSSSVVPSGQLSNAEQEIAAFWQQQGVSLPFASLPESATPLQRAIALEPQRQEYQLTLNRIQYLLWLKNQPWPEIAPKGWLRPGDNHAVIPQIAQRLLWLGDLQEPQTNVYDYSEELAIAVKHFQARHGLKVDAVIGPQTLRWLNVTPQQRATVLAQQFVSETIYRQQLPDSYILVNVPAYELSLVDAGKSVMQSKVIVGLPYRQTPLLQSRISSIVLNPGWHVPRSLLRKDVLPHIRKDGNYLRDRDFLAYDAEGKVVSQTAAEWQQLARGPFPYRLVQQPGRHSALGRYKFHFDNSFDVYLHDTPEKQLFSKAERAFSSGCVRVEKADELAQWLAQHRVKDQRTWRNMQQDYHTTQWFSLKQPLAVYLVYWTAWVDAQGRAQFRDDIYHKFSSVEELR
ncbi:L,D-transpeptidase family protein [Shewanella yunxiaonensis]|uniref:L,D-transpeptidase family protein n=1 Tax=Shewanella yunxiaonensis TaxID=2829809 RepID=A0ABX7YX30_9GAMM|nr:L,D-transpeptidase family protein [Shewanella yunxiaonensis]QUN07368.1 L,D-transpeptidase family protein [Shewanella yunxiaonensis]